MNILCIPYRNREEHLQTFLKTAWPLFQTHFPTTKLVIVEQDNELPFNRGMLLNAGFQEYGKEATWFFTHDIDILPNENTINTIYKREMVDILRIHNPHQTSLGAISKFRSSAFQQINGFPNYCWGWGIEDRALFYRAKHFKITMSATLNKQSKFTFLKHPCNAVQYKNEQLVIHEREEDVFHKKNSEEQKAHIFSSGLNTLHYTVTDRQEIQDCVIHLKVFIQKEEECQQ
jgi:hypothetical protein